MDLLDWWCFQVETGVKVSVCSAVVVGMGWLLVTKGEVVQLDKLVTTATEMLSRVMKTKQIKKIWVKCKSLTCCRTIAVLSSSIWLSQRSDKDQTSQTDCYVELDMFGSWWKSYKKMQLCIWGLSGKCCWSFPRFSHWADILFLKRLIGKNHPGIYIGWLTRLDRW